MRERGVIKVAYICHFSNQAVHSALPLRLSWKDRLLLRLRKKPLTTDVEDSAIWNTNAIEEMKKMRDEVELHVIAPYPYLAEPTYEYVDDCVSYHFYRDDDNLNSFLQRNVIKFIKLSYRRERKRIMSFIERIQPDVVHIVGAENPYYSLSALDIPKNIPLIVQLQTLLNDPSFEKNYMMGHEYYEYRREIELDILRRADYIGTSVKQFIELINKQLDSPRFLKVVLALGEPVNVEVGEKKFDFVYFAADIRKAADYAVEAFILASKTHPGITLDIVGGYLPDFRQQLEARLAEHNLLSQVTFEGKLPSHDDVLKQIRYSRFALLPLKIDLVTGTIRESMANGLPVVTTVTPATPDLNSKRECVLLSEKGDYAAMAENMCRFLDDEELANRLRTNGGLYMEERVSNATYVRTYVDCYKAVLANKREGTAIPESLIS